MIFNHKNKRSFPKGSGIYRIRNLVNGHAYIGSSVNFRARWKMHLLAMKQQRRRHPILERAWRKYGPKSFVFEIVELVANKKMLLRREQHWLDQFKPSYNTCKVAQSRLGVKSSPETRARISASNKGRKMSPSSIRMMIATKLSQHRHCFTSKETRAKIAAKLKGNQNGLGHRKSAKVRLAISLAHKGRKFTKAHRRKLSMRRKLWWANHADAAFRKAHSDRWARRVAA